VGRFDPVELFVVEVVELVEAVEVVEFKPPLAHLPPGYEA
jgi:hypothetical protein